MATTIVLMTLEATRVTQSASATLSPMAPAPQVPLRCLFGALLGASRVSFRCLKGASPSGASGDEVLQVTV